MATVLRNGNEIELVSRPWWISHTVDTPRGLVVARADGVSKTLRLKGGDGPDRYATAPEYEGRFATYMVDLTEDDLLELGLTPGVLHWPNVVDGARPRTNNPSKPVSQQTAQAVVDWLQNDCQGSPHAGM